MSAELATIDPEARRKAWLRRLGEEFLKLEPLMPLRDPLPDEGGPKWVQNVEREVGATTLFDA